MPYPYYNGMYNQNMMQNPSYPQTPYNAAMNGYAQRYEIIQVNGKNGAEAFQMAPNSRVLLLDESAPIVWLKTTDGAGYPTVTAYNIIPAQTQEQQEENRFAALEKRITDLEEAMTNGGKSNSRSIKPKQNGGESGTD